MMENQLTAGHDDTRPALMDLQLFAEEGGAGDAGTQGDSAPVSDTGAVDADGAKGADPAADAGSDDAKAPDDPKTGEADKDEDAAKPDVPEKYDLTIPEGYTVDDNLMAEFTTVAHELGLTNDQANKLAGMHTKIMTEAFQSLNEARNAEVVGWGEAAKTELGKDYDGTLREAALGRDELIKTVPTLKEALDKTGFGNTVECIRLMATVGKLLGEDQGGKDAGGRSAASVPLYNDMANFKK